MKKRILLAITVLLVFGLAVVAFAYNKSNQSSRKASMECCCKDGVCPMKNKDAGVADAKATTACCDSPDCCCKGEGDSCPMKNKGETSNASSVDLKNVTFVSGESCKKDCCKHKKQS
ncbi:MAG: hypothetical protein ABWZ66_08625 [Pyrinomonadaceae bacterium]